MELTKYLVILKGVDKTEKIYSCEKAGDFYKVVFNGGETEYKYPVKDVRIWDNPLEINPGALKISRNGKEFFKISRILQFGSYFRIFFENGKSTSYSMDMLQIEKNSLNDDYSKACLNYFKQIADNVSLTTETGVKLLSQQLSKISFLSENTILAAYLNPGKFKNEARQLQTILFPFGCNPSQITAVSNALSYRLSVIEGPPGTGKTQTILNIIANAVMNGKTVAVVSNNNSATDNVFEKLENNQLDFISAPLGNGENRIAFVENQTGSYPELLEYEVNEIAKNRSDYIQLEKEIRSMLANKNLLAQCRQLLTSLNTEKEYFDKYFREEYVFSEKNTVINSRATSTKLLSFWAECQPYAERGKRLPFWLKLKYQMVYGIKDASILNGPIEDLIALFQYLYFERKQAELVKEITVLENQLKTYNFKDKLENLRDISLDLFRGYLSERYRKQSERNIFSSDDLWKCSEKFTKEYPVIMSTTHSVRSCLSSDYIYDYVIVDEASQVDLVTGVLAMSCARNMVIVGDLKQLPNVVPEEMQQATHKIHQEFKLEKGYDYSYHSLLSSVCEIFEEVPKTLLREHYRCHPKIIEFCNQKFYHGQLIVMTEDKNESDVIKVYKTVPGNHARKKYNQRQIDEIKTSVLPELLLKTKRDEIGIISPYRAQANAVQKDECINDIDVSTVHKFQGREKDAIIITTVDNEITSFTDNPNLLNVAVSRAKNCLRIVISDNEANENTNIGDLVKYIRYNNFEIQDGAVYSVFDMLYKEYAKQKRAYLKNHKSISKYDSENLLYPLLEEILLQDEFSKYDVVIHQPLRSLIKDVSLLNTRQTSFVKHPNSHIDFLIFNRMDKMPVLAIEVDGYDNHKKGTVQHERDQIKDDVLDIYGIKYLRLKTNESGEKERIINSLRCL